MFVAAHKNAVEVVEETPAGLDMLLLFLVLLLSKSPWVPVSAASSASEC